MKRAIAIGIVMLASVHAAQAADLYIPEEPVAIVDGLDWSGAYIGASVGMQGVRVFVPNQGALEGFGVVVGGFAGYNAQVDNTVFGVEADLEYSSFSGSRNCTNPTWTCASYINAQGSLRGRVGYAVEALLFYATGGVAIANFGGSTTNAFGVSYPDSSVRVGWTAGAGVEAAVSENLFGRVEYRYTNLGARDMNFDVAYPGVDVQTHAIRVGVGYKF